MKRWKVVILVLLAIVAVPFLPIDLFRGVIQRSLERGLGRKVEIGGVHLTLLPGILPGPGFTLDGVLIHDDERVGIEPIAYVETLGASVRLTSLLSGKLEFSTLNLNDATINLVRPESGPWNYQLLVQRALGNPLPAVRMRGGRINFKFGDTKALFYFNNADLNFTPAADGAYDLYFAGVPSRTDRAAHESGRLFLNGQSTAARFLDFTVDLEKTEIEEALRWLGAETLGVHGTVTGNARVQGPASHVAVTGNFEIGDVHRWNLLPAESSAFRLDYQGSLDLDGEHLHLQTPANAKGPVSAGLEVSKWLGQPDWDAVFQFREIPLENLLLIARHMGAAIPEMTAAGRIEGNLEYSQTRGLEGQFTMAEGSATTASKETLKSGPVRIAIGGGSAKLEKLTLSVGTQTAEVEGTYALVAQQLDLRLSTRELDLATMKAFGVTALPLLRSSSKGTWRGAARRVNGGWVGELDLRDASFVLDGLAAPIDIDSAVVSLNGPKQGLLRARGSAAGIRLTGEYRVEPDTPRPHRFVVNIPDGAGLAELLAPMLVRDAGVISRTLGLSSAPEVPAWLAARHAEGDVAVGVVKAGEVTLRNISGKLRWDGPLVRIEPVKAGLAGGTLTGELTADLSTRFPKAALTGKLGDVLYRGAPVVLEGVASAGGNVSDFGTSLVSMGRFAARNLSLGEGTVLRATSGDYEWKSGAWKFTNVEADGFKGSANSKPGGKLQLQLMNGDRKIALELPGF